MCDIKEYNNAQHCNTKIDDFIYETWIKSQSCTRTQISKSLGYVSMSTKMCCYIYNMYKTWSLLTMPHIALNIILLSSNYIINTYSRQFITNV